MSEAEKKDKHTFTVHTIGGEKINIEASKFEIREDQNRVVFLEVDEENQGEWSFFLNGIAAIHRQPPEKSLTNWGVGRQGY